MANQIDHKLGETPNSYSHIPNAKNTVTESTITNAELSHTNQKIPKEDIRSSLEASTIDGIFATIFSNYTGGALLSSFLVDLQASTVEIGMLTSLPMLMSFLQPLGAYFSNRTNSRHIYGLWVFAPSRLVWLLLILGIAVVSQHQAYSHYLVIFTLGLVLISNIFAALGSASWLSWLAAIVPSQLRGRYFSIRNILCSLVSLICLPLAGLGVSIWPGGAIQGYGVVLGIGILAGVVSLVFQCFMVDVNPQIQQRAIAEYSNPSKVSSNNLALEEIDIQAKSLPANPLRNPNLMIFLLYLGVWTFAVNLSAPFFNVYMLENLGLEVTWVTLFNSFSAGATMLMLIVWGRVSDRIGNRPLLLGVGFLVAITPFLWLLVNPQHVNTQMLVLLGLLHILAGGTWAAIDLCNNNIQMSIAPVWQHSSFFGLTGAVAGVSGAFGTTVGGYLAQFAHYDGVMGLFALSGGLRLLALLPLFFLQEKRSRSISELFHQTTQALTHKLAGIGNEAS